MTRTMVQEHASPRVDLHVRNRKPLPSTPNPAVRTAPLDARTANFDRRVREADPVGRYDYSAVVYVNDKIKVRIRCVKHNLVFEQAPHDHLPGEGCPECAGRRFSSGRARAEQFRTTATARHAGRYEYDLSTYVDARTPVAIHCAEDGHGWFRQRPTNHLRGQGCAICARHVQNTNLSPRR